MSAIWERGKELSESQLNRDGVWSKQICEKLPVSYPDDKTILTEDYWTPPIGWVYNFFSKQWEKTGVYKRAHLSKDCYWEVDSRFGEYKKWKIEEEKKKKTNPDYIHPQLASFEKDCWRNRMSGFWFNNNGSPTYITGAYWYLISVYQIETGYPPDYTRAQSEMFKHWELVHDDPTCHGMLTITQRRGLKTYSGCCIGVEEATRRIHFRAGMQTKTSKDGAKLFLHHVFYPIRTIPYFFLPKINLPKGDKAPAAGLRFNSGSFLDEGDELLSELTYRASGVNDYNGYMLHYYYSDENAALEEADCYARWLTVKKSLEDKDRKIIGKSFQTTTVEVINSHSMNFLRQWNHSNQFEVEDKITRSGLHKHFIPAQMMQNTNLYGEVDVEANLEKIFKKREKYKNDPKELAKVIRQDPTNEKEALMLDDEDCRFNPLLINNRINDLIFYKGGELFEIGNFSWKDGKRFSEVIWTPNPNGRTFIKEHPQFPNRVVDKFGIYYPDNKQSYCGGADTYDHNVLTLSSERKFSLGSTTILKKYNPMNPTEMDYGVVLFYLFRPENTDIFYEDNLMAAWYYGCEMNIETQKIGLIKHYEKALCENFVPITTNNRRGTPASKEGNIYIAQITEQYIDQYVNTCWFIALLDQWKRFKLEATTEFDGAMSFGYAYGLLLNDYKKKTNNVEAIEIGDVFSFMRNRSISRGMR